MTGSALARRYAAALFDVVERNGQTGRALADVTGIRDLVIGHPHLRKVLETPAIPVARKRAVLDAIVASVGGVCEEVSRLLGLLAERDRLSMLGDVATTFEVRVNEARRIMPAEVVSAVPLQPADRSAIEGALGRATGNDIRLTERVDPSLVGGIVARVGSLVFDGSVTRQLERLRQRLLTGA